MHISKRDGCPLSIWESTSFVLDTVILRATAYQTSLQDKRQSPISFATRSRWVCPWLPVRSSLGRDCAPSPTTDKTQPQTFLKWNREDISTLINRLGLSNPDYCRSWKQTVEEESIEYLSCFCWVHNLKRFQTLGSYTPPNLADIQIVNIPKLLCFLKRTNCFEKPHSPWAREKDLYRDYIVLSGGISCL